MNPSLDPLSLYFISSPVKAPDLAAKAGMAASMEHVISPATESPKPTTQSIPSILNWPYALIQPIQIPSPLPLALSQKQPEQSSVTSDASKSAMTEPLLKTAPNGMAYYPQWLIQPDVGVAKAPSDIKPKPLSSPKPKIAEADKPLTLKDITYTPFAQAALNARKDNSLSRKEKLKKAEVEALQFLQDKVGQKDAILKGLESLGINVLRGETTPWVNDFLDTISSEEGLSDVGSSGAGLKVVAAIYTPDTINYPNALTEVINDQRFTEKQKQLKDYVAFDQQSEREGIVSFMARNGESDNLCTLYHEVFHVFQLKNGLIEQIERPYNLDDYNALQEKAIQKTQSYGIYFWGVPHYWMKFLRAVGLFKPEKETIAEEMRLASRSEIEAAQFLKKNRKTLHLSSTDLKWNQQYKSYHQWLAMYSYAWDWPRTGLFKNKPTLNRVLSLEI